MRLLADMELFVELATLQNFGKAAAALSLSASTLSRRITRLESELGTPLIRRSTRSFVLTESGQEFLERAKAILADAARARDEIGRQFATVSGRLRVGGPTDLATTILPPMFARYCRDNPNVSIEIIATSAQPNLASDGLDAAFAVAHQASLPDSTYLAHRVGSFSRMLYASRQYLKRRGSPLTPQDLRAHACLRHINRTAEKCWDLYQGRKRESVAIDGPYASSSVILSAQAAREHLGIAMLPRHLASHPTFGAGLTRVLPDWEGMRANVFALAPTRVVSAKTRELIRIVKAEFARRVAQLEAEY